MFKNMKIGLKLGVGFGLAVLLMIAIALMGISGMKSSNTNMEDIVSDNMHKMELVNTMSESVHIVSRVIRSIVLLDDVEAMKEEGKKLAVARDAYDKAWAELEKMPASERGMAIRARITEASKNARPINNKIIELAEDNKDDEARHLLLKEGGPAVKKWQDALDENLVLQKDNNIRQAAEAAADYSRASTIMIALSIVGVALSLVLAFVITRGITRPLSEAVGVANALAEGDMTVKIEVNSKDETGQLLGAMQAMVEKLSQIIGEVNAAATNIASASEEVSSTAQSMSQATNEQAASVEETSASVEHRKKARRTPSARK